MGKISKFFADLFTAPSRAKYDMRPIANNYMRFGATTTTGSKYPGGLSKSGIARVYDSNQIRRNARDAQYDSVLAAGITDRFADSIVDTGLRLKLEPNADVLGITQEQASKWATEVSDRFHLYAMSKQSDLTGDNNLYQNQRLYSVFQIRDNDMFTRLHYSKNPNLISPLQIQFIDPDQLSGNQYVNTFGYQTNNYGIERDKNGKEIAYNIAVSDGKNGFKQAYVPAEKNGRKIMLHGFRKQYADQGQGYSVFAHALQEFEQITDFTQAQILKAIHESQFTYYTKPSSDAPASNPLADFTRPVGAVDSNTSETSSLNYEPGLSKFTQLHEVNFDQPGGVFMASLQEGEDIGSFDSVAPSDKFESFVDTFSSYLCSSVGMPIEVLKMKFGENYSASRATLVIFWRILEIWRAEMATDFLNPVVEMWLAEEIAAGRINAPGFSNPIMKAAWLQSRWIGSSLPSLNPKDEAVAVKHRIELGHDTLEGSALTYNASNAAHNTEKLKSELAGLPIPNFAANYQYTLNSEDQ